MGQKYNWTIGQEPPPIDPHSFAKHKVYEEYVSHYIQVLNANPRIPGSNLTIVDGFAGGGEYLDSENKKYKGSPLRLLDAAKEGETLVNVHRQNLGMNTAFSLNSEFYFTEKDKSNHAYLRQCLINHNYESDIGRSIFPIQADFKTALPGIMENIKRKGRSGRCLFFLDQYGYKEVPFGIIRRIFNELNHAEVILTFATGHLVDYLSDDERSVNIIRELDLHGYVDLKYLMEAKEDTPEWRRFVQYHLHQALVPASGAKHFTPFFITSTDSNRSYWLVHLSNHPVARDVMTELHWKHKNQFGHYLDSGIYMFGYDPANDESLSNQMPLLGDDEDSKKYVFDKQAKERTLKQLLIELPEYLTDYKEGIQYQEFFKNVCNHTPATEQIIKEGFQHLIDDSDIFMISENNSKRRSANQIKGKDILIRNSQTRFLFGT